MSDWTAADIPAQDGRVAVVWRHDSPLLNGQSSNLIRARIYDLGPEMVVGTPGADTLTGTFGNDWYLVDNPGDVVAELVGGGTLDRVSASVSYILPAGSEIESLSTTDTAGTGPIDLTGSPWRLACSTTAAAPRAKAALPTARVQASPSPRRRCDSCVPTQ